MQQGPLYIQLPHMRLAVVREKYWRAILHKDILIEFCSSKHPTRLDAGNCLLFALAIRHRRTGKDDLIFARVLRVEVLEVREACKVYAREAEDCKQADLAAKWAVTRVRCFMLDKASIRIAGEIANRALPHFCHVRDLGKSVSVILPASIILPAGKIVHCTLRRPMPSHHYDSRVRSAEDSTSGGEESTTMDRDGGMHPTPRS